MERQSDRIDEAYQEAYHHSEQPTGSALQLGDATEPITAMLARALMYSQHADRELEQARALKVEAERYRAQIQRETVEKTEAFCNGLREKAVKELERVQQLVKVTNEKEEAAEAAMKEAENVRDEADAYVAKMKAEAEEQARSIRAQAEAEAHAFVDRTRANLQEEIKMQQQRVDEEIRRALGGIEKVRSAIHEELGAQKMFTEALRMRAYAPRIEEIEIPEDLNELLSDKVDQVRPRMGRTRQRAAS